MSAKRVQQSVDGARSVEDWLSDWTPKLQSVAGSSAGDVLLQKVLIPLFDDVLGIASALLEEDTNAVDAMRGPVLRKLLEKEGLAGATSPGSGGGEPAAEDALVPPRPPGMATPDEVTDFMRDRQRRDPTRWTMTIQQWSDIIDHIVSLPQYQAMKKAKRSVSMYDVNDFCVKPWTQGTGCSVAVLMSKDVEAQAQLMLSHAWGEDVEEMQESVMNYVKQEGIPLDAAIWFCVFGNYQPGDKFGPSIGEQLEMNPFASVIGSDALKTTGKGQGMLAVHTTRADLYSRLWCVHEVERASNQEGIRVAAAMSEEYIKGMVSRVRMLKQNGGTGEECLEAADIFVNTIKAKCGNPADEPMLIKLVQETGGFKKLDQIVSDFRMAMLPEAVLTELISECGLTLEAGGPEAQKNLKACRVAVRNNFAEYGAVHDSLRDHLCLAWARPFFQLKTIKEFGIRFEDYTLKVLKGLGEADRAKALQPMIPMLVGALGSAECGVRQGALEMLSSGRVSVKVAELVGERLRDENEKDVHVQGAAQDCLSRLAKSTDLQVSAMAKHLLEEHAYDCSTGDGESVREFAKCPVEELLTDIDDDDVRKVEMGCLLLGKKRAVSAVPKLTELLKRDSKMVRKAAARALARMGEDAAPALSALKSLVLEEEDANIQGAAVTALGSIRTEATVELLVDIISVSCIDVQVQRSAMQSLGRLGNVAATKASDLVELLLEEEDGDTRFGLELIKLLTTLADLQPDAVVPAFLANLVICNKPDCPWHEGVPGALSSLGAAAAPAALDLAKGLDSEDWRPRQLAAKALGAMGEHAEAAAPALAKCLDDGNSDVREAVCEALVKIGAKAVAAAPEILKCCDDNGCLTMLAVRCLGAIGVAVQDEASPPLLQYAEAAVDEEAIAEVAVALCKVGQAEALLPLLGGALENGSGAELAARVLASLGRAALPMVPKLVELVELVPRDEDGDEDSSLDIQYSSLKGACVRALEAIAKDGAAADIAEAVVPVLLDAAEDHGSSIRVECLRALLAAFSDLPAVPSKKSPDVAP